jgi:putative FmdB family regulatory protein
VLRHPYSRFLSEDVVPTYEYACKSCGHHLEVVQSFRDSALTDCPSCGGSLRKVFGNIGIAFKGSGFYKTDSRSSAGGSAPKADTAAKSDAAASTKSDAAASAKSESTGSGSSSGSSSSGSSESAKAS